MSNLSVEARVALNDLRGFEQGQIADGYYLSRQGARVQLTTVWEGANHLSGDPESRRVSFGTSPNIKGREGQIVLTTNKVVEPGYFSTERIVFREDAVWKEIGLQESRLSLNVNDRVFAERVLGNIRSLTREARNRSGLVVKQAVAA